MKKVLLILSLALLAAGCTGSYNASYTGDKANPISTSGQTSNNVITYNGTTFSPSSLSVKKGEIVTFINNSSGAMSVASNPHPTHTDYPGFDQYKSSQRGQKTYTFTFENVGIWGYHNHLNPSAGGTIIVQ